MVSSDEILAFAATHPLEILAVLLIAGIAGLAYHMRKPRRYSAKEIQTIEQQGHKRL